MLSDEMFPQEGGCDCGKVRYRMVSVPLFVHCCHCRWCQRETGTAFALNAMVEADRLVHLNEEPEIIDTPSASGKGQKIARCPQCRVAVWSNYAGAGEKIRFVRVGTFDQAELFAPDVHIFTETKQPWVILPSETPAFPVFYDPNQQWSKAVMARWKAATGH